MAKTSVKTRDKEEDDVIDVTPEDTEYSDPIDTLLSAFDGGAEDERINARVYRINGAAKDGMTQPFLFTVTPEEVEGIQERLRDNYGSGKYLIRMFRNGRFFKQVPYQVEAPNKATVAANDPNSVPQVLSVVREMMADFRKEMAEERGKVTVIPPAPDPMAMLEKMTTVMANMRGLVPASAAQANAPAQPSMEAVFGFMERGMELGRQMSSGGSDDSIMGLIKGVVLEVARQPAFGEILAGFMARMQPPQANGHEPAAIQPPPVTEPNVPPNATPAQQALIRTLNYLTLKASQNKDVALYVDWFIDETDPQVVQAMLSQANLLDQLCALHPGVRQHREWFARFIDVAREPLHTVEPGTPEDDQQEETPQAHDSANTVDGDAGRE